jgi:hypothetical protein
VDIEASSFCASKRQSFFKTELPPLFSALPMVESDEKYLIGQYVSGKRNDCHHDCLLSVSPF